MSFPNVAAAWKKDLVYKKVAGVEIAVTVWAPKNIQGKHPLIVQYHPVGLLHCHQIDACLTNAQGWTGGDRFSWLPEYLLDEALARGTVWASFDYRLIPTATGEEIFTDVTDAYKWATDELPAIIAKEGLGELDLKRIGVVGLSAGGWCAAVAVDQSLQGPHPAKALYEIYPEAGMDRPYYNSNKAEPVLGILTPPPGEIIERKTPVITGVPLIDFSKDREYYKAQGGDNLWVWDQNTYCLYLIQYLGYAVALTGGDEELRKKLAASEDPDDRRAAIGTKYKHLFPQLNARKEWPPTVITHGEADSGVPHEDSVFWKSELDRYGVKNLLVSVPGVDHGFDIGTVNKDGDERWDNYLKKPVLYFLDEVLLP